MAQFIILLRDESWDPSRMSPEEMQQIFGRYRAWVDSMNGKGNKLADDEGRVLRGDASNPIVTDGPYAEAKEVMGGYLVVEASDYDEVVAKCRQSPHLQFGSIEIRRIEMA